MNDREKGVKDNLPARELTRIEVIRQLRRNATEAQKRLWEYLRRRGLAGCRFRRQHPVGPYIVDFACLERKLIIDVYGGQLVGREADERRTCALSRRGYQVLRFNNQEVLENTARVLSTICEALGSSPHSSPQRGEEEEGPQIGPFGAEDTKGR